MNNGVVHRSKIGLGILIPVIVVLGSTTILMVFNSIWVGLFVCGLCLLLIGNVYSSTYYQITSSGHLIVRCGIIEKYDIEINDIEWIKNTRSLLSAPALSTDRIEIAYKGGSILISPADKSGFIDELRKINPRIWWASPTSK
jgi:hypothetical protein